LGHCGRDKTESVGVDESARDTFRLNFRHMARYALTARTTGFVLRVLFQGGRVRAVRRRRAVTIETNPIGWLSQLSIVRRTMRIVTGGACDSMPVHHTLHKIVSLHSVLARRAVRKIVERGLAECAVLQFPEILQL
jgi:hypothetical protein